MAIDQAEAQAKGKGKRAHSLNTFARESQSAGVSASLSAALARLASPEGVDKVLRSAAHAGSIVLYDELRAKTPVRTGSLQQSIYRWFDDNRSRPGRQIYMVGPNKKKAGHWAWVEFGHWRYNKPRPDGKGWMRSKVKKGKGADTHGGPGALAMPVWVPAKPYLRPAWEARKGDILKAMQRRAGERIREVLAGIE